MYRGAIRGISEFERAIEILTIGKSLDIALLHYESIMLLIIKLRYLVPVV